MRKQSRREFIKVVSLSGTGLLIAAYTPLNGFFKKMKTILKYFRRAFI